MAWAPVGGLFGAGNDLEIRVLRAAEDVAADFVLRHLGIIDDHFGILREQVAADRDGGGFTCVVGVFLERESENGDALAGDRVEEFANDARGEAMLLPVVDLHDAFPIISDFRKAEMAAEVNEVEDVLWKQEPPKPTEALRNFGPMRESLPIA